MKGWCPNHAQWMTIDVGYGPYPVGCWQCGAEPVLHDDDNDDQYLPIARREHGE